MSKTASCYSEILKETSRAFYLSLAVLPKAAREPLSLAYMLARAADTVADSPSDRNAERTPVLKQIQCSLREPQPGLADRLTLFHPEKTGEVRLLEEYPNIVRLLYELTPPSLQESVRQVVTTLVDGMLWDQQLFQPKGSRTGLDMEELERYTFLVAGCVGPFWSEVCAHSDPRLNDLVQQHDMSVEFGKALQWVNILRDAPKDQVEGRYYLPPLETNGFRESFLLGSRRAMKAFNSACRYPLLFPALYMRHRLAVFLPLALGLRTLELLFVSGGPRQGKRIKVSRNEVFLWCAAGLIGGLSDTFLRTVLRRLRRRTRFALRQLEIDFETSTTD
jgi:farnesyl-diphosphate farnesyltransferase